MTRLRPSRIIAIARRDLAMELRGGRGWVLPAVMVGLLGPAASVPLGDRLVVETSVRGDVPPAVAEQIPVRSEARTVLSRDAQGKLAVKGPLPAEVRRALDGDSPAIALVDRSRPWPVPGRTALLALIASSTLTGAIAGSIPGERSARTLSALLAAAVSREEIAVGKWLAWGGLGAAASVLAALVSVATGRATLGPWIVALPFVPLGTVAFGLWLVRTAGDALSGSTTSIRVVPAVVGGLALAAWGLSLLDPRLGPLVPVGGAVLAAGSTWGPSWGPALIACASSALASAVWLAATARDLDEAPVARAWSRPTSVAAAAVVGAATSWAVFFPDVWAAAGNPAYAEEIAPVTAVWSAAWLGGWAAAVGASRLAPGSERPVTARWLWVVPIGIAVALATHPLSTGALARHLAALLTPPVSLAAIALVFADEALYRGVFRRWLGTPGAALAWTAVRAPTDPLLGLASGLGLGWLAESHWAAAVAARLIWLLLAGLIPDVPGGMYLGAATIAAILAAIHRRSRAPIAPRGLTSR